jgi:DNA-binding IclR family transcriptional regulator
MSDEKSTAVKSADRTLTVLEFLSAAGAPRSLGEIADELEIPKSSLHGLLRNLQSRGWLSTDESDAGLRYRIGPQALTVGASYLQSDDIVRRSSAMLDSLSFELGETIHLGVLENVDVMYLAKRDARHNLRLVSGVGVRLPAYATALGKALLAELDKRVLTQRLSAPRRYMTPKTLVDERVLREDLNLTLERGYAIDDEESTEGVRCFAVALGGTVPRRHAVSCSIPVARLDDGFEHQVISTLIAAANNFSEPDGIGLIAR